MIKAAIKGLLRTAGFELRRITPASHQLFDLARALKYFEVDLVLDVGANTGQFARRLRTAGYAGRIVSFEPLEAEHRQLQLAARADDAWQVHERGAVGDRDGEITINIARNSVSSSVLPMMQLHSEAAQHSHYVGSQVAPIFRLDSVAGAYLRQARRPFLKIDTQGFEAQVLDGARATLPELCGVLCELSLAPLYQGQTLWLQMIERLQRDGFEIWSISKGFTDLRNGRTLQVDAAFFRPREGGNA
jgi:FkbM family methyltransferase